jgi:hypothetical protein
MQSLISWCKSTSGSSTCSASCCGLCNTILKTTPGRSSVALLCILPLKNDHHHVFDLVECRYLTFSSNKYAQQITPWFPTLLKNFCFNKLVECRYRTFSSNKYAQQITPWFPTLLKNFCFNKLVECTFPTLLKNLCFWCSQDVPSRSYLLFTEPIHSFFWLERYLFACVERKLL